MVHTLFIKKGLLSSKLPHELMMAQGGIRQQIIVVTIHQSNPAVAAWKHKQLFHTLMYELKLFGL
ncbi:hypothetical protein HPL003_01640 [Paenibacillus terrae HPL-003]|uniref:Uncharacterized protein n=1 Tax=Paenibacillus terrae (strain HPL-003) TaxID=985665 RepID=G7VWP7_PAETH|nr:hypothetical protein HPL003_01640 [Paenibacillus terrae HPL-003]